MSFKSFDEHHHSGVEWLGAIPSHWEVDRLKRRCRVIASNVDKKSRDGEADVMLCNYTDVYYNDVIDRSIDFMPATATAEQIDRFTLLAGDTIITKDSEEADDIAISAYVPESLQGVICGYHLSIIRPLSRADGAFVKRLFDSQYVRAKAEIQANGLTRVGLGLSAIQNLEMPWPPIDEQRRIAAFLDRETAKIDALAAEQERLIELLEEKRRAVISHAVTKGLDPKVPMKDSGVRWLGSAPAHWTVKRLKFLCRMQTGSKDTQDAVNDGAYPFFVRSQQVERINSQAFDCEAVLTAGDGVGVGKVFHHYTGPFDFHQRVYMFNEFQNVQGRFFFEFLRANFFKVALEGGAKSTVDSLRRPMLANFEVCVPPMGEQVEIIQFIEASASEFEKLIHEAQVAIGLLSERRSALISAAVTGQIDVRQHEAA
jgi:type I restriction enzyme S subunit